MITALVVLVVAVALAFDYTNGFHDAADAIATSVSTRALTPRVALLMAATFNLLGALLGTGIAETIGNDILDTTEVAGRAGLVIVLCAVLGAIAWNLVTWWLGLPSSSSHALIGGLAGVGVVSASHVQWSVLVGRVIVPMVVAPAVAFVLAYAAMIGLLWCFRDSPTARTMRRFRMAQTASAAAMALGHGLQDAQKTMGVIVLALATGGFHDGTGIPLWVICASAAAISLGTYSGGWRIMRTLGRRVIELDPARGVVAESIAASVLYTTAFVFRAPISTTHAITAAIMGAGSTRRFSAVRWGVVSDIALAWLLTLPAAGAIAAVVYLLVAPVLG